MIIYETYKRTLTDNEILKACDRCKKRMVYDCKVFKLRKDMIIWLMTIELNNRLNRQC